VGRKTGRCVRCFTCQPLIEVTREVMYDMWVTTKGSGSRLQRRGASVQGGWVSLMIALSAVKWRGRGGGDADIPGEGGGGVAGPQGVTVCCVTSG
jgi:hypothetical protein